MVGSTFVFGTVEIQERSPVLRDSGNGSLWKPLKAPSAVKKWITGCPGLCFLYGCMLALITWHCEFWFIDWAISCTGHRISAVKTPVAVHYQVQRLAFRRPLVGLVEHRRQQAVCPRRSLGARGSSSHFLGWHATDGELWYCHRSEVVRG